MKTRTFIAILWGIAAVSFIGCSTPRKLAGSTKETAKTEEKRNETDGKQYENRRRRSNLYENRVFPAETRYPAGKAGHYAGGRPV